MQRISSSQSPIVQVDKSTRVLRLPQNKGLKENWEIKEIKLTKYYENEDYTNESALSIKNQTIINNAMSQSSR